MYGPACTYILLGLKRAVSFAVSAKEFGIFCDKLDQKNIYEKTKIQFVAKKEHGRCLTFD